MSILAFITLNSGKSTKRGQIQSYNESITKWLKVMKANNHGQNTGEIWTLHMDKGWSEN